MRSKVFARRTLIELLRDPLSYIFCLGFPLIMLIIMTIVNDSIPPQANMTVFQIANLAPGIAVFGLTFVMLFTCLQVGKDRSTAFLIRLYASPMKSWDFIAGYTYPVMIIAVLQCVITFVAAVIIGAMKGYNFQIGNLILCLLTLIPSAILFIGLGLFFATLVNDKAAPGISSICITAVSLLGGIWMDIDGIGGTLAKVCKVLPFYHGVRAARMAIHGQLSGIGKPLGIILLYAFIIYTLAVFVFRRKMQSDLK